MSEKISANVSSATILVSNISGTSQGVDVSSTTINISESSRQETLVKPNESNMDVDTVPYMKITQTTEVKVVKILNGKKPIGTQCKFIVIVECTSTITP